MDVQEQSYYFFRKLVYVLYKEIGALQPRVHPQLASKALITSPYFQGERERQAAELYLQIEHETDLGSIVAGFEQRTGLTLDDIHRAFVDGDWRNKFGAYNFGGPKWVRIAEAALELRASIAQEDWDRAAGLVQDIKSLKTNQGYLVNMFEWTERRRS